MWVDGPIYIETLQGGILQFGRKNTKLTLEMCGMSNLMQACGMQNTPGDC